METFTPPAIAASHSPCRRLWHARWMAVSEDEHIVSTAIDGPVKLQKYETRLAIAEGLPDNATGLPCSASSAPNSWYSSYITPTNTPTLPGRPGAAGLPSVSGV